MAEFIDGAEILRPKTVDEVILFLDEGCDWSGIPDVDHEGGASNEWNELVTSMAVGEEDSRLILVIYDGDYSVGMKARAFLIILPDGWTYEAIEEERRRRE